MKQKLQYGDRVITDFGRKGTLVDKLPFGCYLVKWDDGGANYQYDFNFSKIEADRLQKLD